MNLGNNVNYGGEAKIADQLDASDLAYLADEETNVVVERSQKKLQAQKTTYAERDTVVFTFNTGQDFISSLHSALELKLKLVTPTAVTFGGGSILNLFETMRIVGRDGSVLTEVSQLNMYNYFALKLNHTYEWRKHQQGSLMLGSTSTPVSDGLTYVIPLKDIIPFFDQSVLLPANISRGMRIEIVLAPKDTAFTGTSLGEYSVEDPKILLDSYRLSGGAMAALNQMAASSGLVMTYKDVNNSRSAKDAAALSINLEARQAVSMANSVFTAVRLTSNITSFAADSFATRPAAATDDFQYRIGSVYLPQERIVGPVQYYAQTAYCWGKTSHGGELGIRSAEKDDNALACATLDRYHTAGSGMAINASTVLTFSSKQLIDACDVDMFLTHTRRITAFLENMRVLD
jgi:hypothetical protein